MASTPIALHKGDITGLNVDAIVNAANPTLLGGGGVDGAIHSAAGPQLLEYCKTLGGCRTGQAKLSPGFNLTARWIIHTVGPIWEGGSHGEAKLLASCYHRCLDLARSVNIKSVAFPAISAGVYGYPLDQAAQIAVDSIAGASHGIDDIILVCFSDAAFAAYTAALESQSRLNAR